MDDWDEILNIEAQSYQKGAQNAKIEVESSEDKEGIQAGFLKGFAIGFETGFMEEISTQLLEKYQSNIDEAHPNKYERQIKRSTELLEKAQTIPLSNDETIDFDNQITTMRNLYKQLGNPAGPFPPNLSESNEPEVSHEW